MNNIILASQSPRRKDLLNILGLDFDIKVSSLDESKIKISSPEKLVSELAFLKAKDISDLNPNSYVIGSDTLIAFDNKILGKPKDGEDAFNTLNALQGNMHLVYGSFSILNKEKNININQIDSTKVYFSSLSQKEINDYLDKNESMDKAGSYAIQGFAASFIEKIEGNYTNVIGLNISLVREELKKLSLL